MAILKGELFISKGFIVVIQERVMATKNYCRHVMGRKLGWRLVYKILSGKAVARLGIFMLLLSPAISLERGSING